VVGVRLALGRAFLPEEDQVSGKNPVVVLGYGLWRRRFAADPGILGRKVGRDALEHILGPVAIIHVIRIRERISLVEFQQPLGRGKR
jgi:hypothetical protein